MKTALLLDFDGTLVDSLSALQSAYFEFLKEFDIEGTLAEFQEFNGPPLSLVIGELRARYSLRAPENELLARYLEIVGTSDVYLRLSPGAASLLTVARDRGMKIAIVTSSPVDRISQWLDRHELAEMFTSVVGADSTERGKPHADPYLLALEKLSVTPHEAITVEDSVTGATASLSAGVRTILLGGNGGAFEHPLLLSMGSLHDVTSFLQQAT